MKKFLYGMFTMIFCLMIIDNVNALVDAELPAVSKMSISIDDKAAKEVNGFVSENNLYYVDLTDFCSTYSSLCSYDSKEDTVTRYIIDKEYSSDTILFEIQISNLQYNTTNASTIGIVTISGTNYVMSTTLLDSPIYKTDSGKVYVSVRFLAEGLGCNATITEGNISINSDGYNEQTFANKSVEVMYLNSDTMVKSLTSLTYSKDSKKYTITLPESEKANSTSDIAFNSFKWIINNGEAYNYNAYKNSINPTTEDPFTITFSIKQTGVNMWGYVIVEVNYVSDNEFTNLYSVGDSLYNYVTCVYTEEKEKDPNEMTMVHVGTLTKTDVQNITIKETSGNKKEFCSSCTYAFITYYEEPARADDCPKVMYYSEDSSNTSVGLFDTASGDNKYNLTNSYATSGAEFVCSETCLTSEIKPFSLLEKYFINLVAEVNGNDCYCRVTK